MTVLGKGTVAPVVRAPFTVAAIGEGQRVALSDAGGLEQFGAAIEVLEPGARSSNRHWHSAEDEFLWMLEGEAVLVEEDGETLLRPGDAAAWPKGVANGHMLENRAAAPCRYLIVGFRVEDDICRYPDLGRTLFGGRHWRLIDDATGDVIREGDG